MEQLLIFFKNYGLWISIIAIAGIALLGVLKYCKVFDKIEENKRHYLYIGISFGFSIIGTAIYLLCVKSFDWNYLFAVGSAMFALNQTFYALFKTTPVNELATNLLNIIVKIYKQYIVKSISTDDEIENDKNN